MLSKMRAHLVTLNAIYEILAEADFDKAENLTKTRIAYVIFIDSWCIAHGPLDAGEDA